MLKRFNKRANEIGEAYLNGPRKSWFVGLMTLPPLIAVWVKLTNLNYELGSNIVIGTLVITFIGLLSLVAFENSKWRMVPVSTLICMAFGLLIARTLASVTENTPEQVLNSSLLLMAIFGIYGLCASVMGTMIHGEFQLTKTDKTKSS